MGQKEQASSPINRDALRLIRDAFADSGLTQQALAEASGVPRSTLANILSPTADPRLIHVEQLVRVAIAFEIDPRDWVGELEARERKRRARGGRSAPPAQKRAARRGRRPFADEA